MNNPEPIKDLSEESPKIRKRKLLNNPDICWAKCQVCKEAGNLENLLRHGIPLKNSAGVEIYKAFGYVYFCSENCRGLFGS